jgi:hypothetical protein
MLTAAERRERARVAANERWARPGAREAQSQTLRAATRRRLEDQVDPDRVMTEGERDKAVANAAAAIAARLRAAKAKRAS